MSVLFIMLNPSVADSSADDPTVRKCIGFARRWGFNGPILGMSNADISPCGRYRYRLTRDGGAVEIVNLFAWRSTDPRGVLAAEDPIGPLNNSAIADALQSAEVVVCAWGAHATSTLRRIGPDRIAFVRGMLLANMVALGRVAPQCLGRSADGSPRHPLMLAYSTPLESFV